MSTTKSDLPPSRNRKPALRPVSPPLSNVSMHRFNYWIASAAALLLAFYAWSVVSIKLDQASTGIAMWYHSIFGNGRRNTGSGSDYAQPSTITETSKAKGNSDREGMSIDERIEDLASALGMPESTDLASAIGEAIRAYIPPASLSSISAHQTGYASYFFAVLAANTTTTFIMCNEQVCDKLPRRPYECRCRSGS